MKVFYDIHIIRSKLYEASENMKKSPEIVSTELWTGITISLLILSILITILYGSQIEMILALLGFITLAVPDIYNKIKGWFFVALSTILIILISK